MNFWQILQIVGLNSVILIISLVAKELYGRGKRDQVNRDYGQKLSDAIKEMKNIRQEMVADFENLTSDIKTMKNEWETRYERRVDYVDNHYVSREHFINCVSNLDRRLSLIENQKLGEQLAEIKANIQNLTKSIESYNEQLLDVLKNWRN